MKIANKVLEGIHQDTKVRLTYEKVGTRKARLTIKEAKRMLELVLKDESGPPYPKDANDRIKLEAVIRSLDPIVSTIKDIKERGK